MTSKNDGMIHSFGNGEVWYSAKKPNQIKSATDNNGEFSTENDGIQMAVEGNSENNSIFVSQSDLDNALSIINEAIQSDKWNQKSLQQLNNLLNEIKNGRIEYKRYPGRVHEAYRKMAGGRAAGAWLLYSRDDRTMEEKSRTLTPAERYEREEADKPGQERTLKAWAKAAGVWYEDVTDPVNGMEHKENLDDGEAEIYVKMSIPLG